MDDKKITVFLADDHKVLRDGLVMLLEADPLISVAGQCRDGREVVRCVQDIKPDVVILDITLPSLNGLDVCQELSRKVPDTAVVILTMHSNEEFVIEALENGALGYLLKDVAADEVISAIHAASRGESYLGTGIEKSVLSRLNKNDSDPYKQLTPREKQVLQLIAEGKTSRQAAQELSISCKTVDTHRNRLMGKLDIHHQTELVKYAIRKGIITLH